MKPIDNSATATGFTKSHPMAFSPSPMYNSVTGAFGHDRGISGSVIESNETSMLRKQNKQKLMNSSVQMKFPENSPYNIGRVKEFKPN